MNAQPSKEKLSQCKLFIRFIEKEQILIEDTGKEKSQLSRECSSNCVTSLII
jgi:hypothetical protein